MYKSLSADELRKVLKLPDGYTVDGMLCYGTWNINQHKIDIEEALKKMGVAYDIKSLPGFLSKMLEINIGSRKIWFDVSYGGTQLSEFLHFACMFGSKKNILLGSCGGLSENLSTLDFVVPTESYGDESTTRMYEREAKDNLHAADKELAGALAGGVKDEHRVFLGKTMTCQAMLAETLEDIEEWSKTGYLGVEMEASTVFAVSKHFGVPAAALLYVTDNLIANELVGSEAHIAAKSKREELRSLQYQIALKEMLK